MKDMVLMPRALTAENGAKYEFIGEFFTRYSLMCGGCDGIGMLFIGGKTEECPACHGDGQVEYKIPIPWTAIKDIYAKAVELLGKEVDDEG
jgi:hypothetical protein